MDKKVLISGVIVGGILLLMTLIRVFGFWVDRSFEPYTITTFFNGLVWGACMIICNIYGLVKEKKAKTMAFASTIALLCVLLYGIWSNCWVYIHYRMPLRSMVSIIIINAIPFVAVVLLLVAIKSEKARMGCGIIASIGLFIHISSTVVSFRDSIQGIIMSGNGLVLLISLLSTLFAIALFVLSLMITTSSKSQNQQL